MIRILDWQDAKSLVARKTARLDQAERVVAPILADVRKRGDAALLDYARKFDGFARSSVRVQVAGSLAPDLQSAIETAARTIRQNAQRQLPRESMTEYPG